MILFSLLLCKKEHLRLHLRLRLHFFRLFIKMFCLYLLQIHVSLFKYQLLRISIAREYNPHLLNYL